MFLRASLGDGDDSFTAPDGEIDGGAGNDVLAGDSVTGGPGRDSVRARFIRDADGARPVRDRYEGEWVSYEGRKTGLRDLRGGRAGEDVLVGVTSATGGDGDDVLIGTRGPNTLWPGLGRDRVVALGGDDKLTGEGRDRFDAGPGDDTLELGSRASGMRVQCGAGDDAVTNSHPSTRLTGCEKVYVVFATAGLRERLSGPGAAVLVAKGCWCVNGRWVVYHGKETIGAARGRRDRVVLRLNARGRARLARERRLSVRIEFHEGDDVEGFRTELRLR